MARKGRHELYRVLPDGRWAFWFDHSNLDKFSKCEQLFDYSVIQNYRIKGFGSAAMLYGSWWSNVMERYYQLPNTVERGPVQPPSIGQLVKIAVEEWLNGEVDNLEVIDPKNYFKLAQPTTRTDIARALGDEAAEVMFGLYKRQANLLLEMAHAGEVDATPEGQAEVLAMRDRAQQILARTEIPLGPIMLALKYHDTYAEQDARDWIIVAAEKAFGAEGEVMVGEDDKVVVYYMGKPDLVVFEQKTDLLMPVDHKTKDLIPYDVNSIWKPHGQTCGYIFALNKICESLGFARKQVNRCVINVAGRCQPGPTAKNQKRTQRVRPCYMQQEIDEWAADIMLRANRLRQAIERGTFEKREAQCHIYGGCNFRRVCSVPPGARTVALNADFVKVQPWSPYGDEE